MKLTLQELVVQLEKLYGNPTRTKRDAEGTVHFQPNVLDELIVLLLQKGGTFWRKPKQGEVNPAWMLHFADASFSMTKQKRRPD